MSESGDDGNDGRTWETAKRTVSAAVRELPQGGEVWIAAGTYYDAIYTAGRSLYGGFAGNEFTRSQRNPTLHPTILDGSPDVLEGLGIFPDSIIVVQGADFDDTIIDGLIIRNAQAFSGGAVNLGYYAYGVVQNCILSNNVAFNMGGAIYCSYSGRGSVSRTVIRGNSAASGGGLAVDGGGALESVASCLVLGNSASDGGGIWCNGRIEFAINNTVVKNSAGSGGALSYPQGQGIN